jgi:hypothetical protein
LLSRRSEVLDVCNLELWRSGIVGGLAFGIILASIDLIGIEGSCNLRRRGDPLEDFEPIYAFAISAGEAT